MKNIPISNLLGMPISALTMNQALDIIHDAITNRRRLQIGVVNAAKISAMRKNRSLGEDVLASDLLFADGSAVVWATKLLGRPVPERIAGIDLMMRMLERGNRHGYRVYCLGAKEEVSKKVVERIAERFPNVVIAGRHHGYFTEEQEAEIAEKIAASRPDIMFVAITSPKKEKFMAKWGAAIGVPVCHGVGGSFDVLAGMVQRAPLAWQRLGLEWLYRLKQEPRRLLRRYAVTNTVFTFMVLRELLGNCARRNAGR